MSAIRRKLGATNPGTDDYIGSDEWDYQIGYMTGDDQSVLDPVDINTYTRFYNSKFALKSSDQDFDFIFQTSTLAADRTIIVPTLTATANLILSSVINTFTVGQIFDNYIKSKPIAEPTTDATYGSWYSDSGDSNKPKFKKPDGTVIDLSPSAGSGEANTGANVGSGAGVFRDKTTVTLNLRALNSANSKLGIVENANDITFTINEANIKLDDLGATDDNTDLDATTTKHGLMKKFPGGTTTFLRADATFATPAGGGGSEPANGESASGQWGKISARSGFGVLGGYFERVIASSGTITGYRSASEHGLSFAGSASNAGAGMIGQVANLYRELVFTLTMRWQIIKNGSNSTNIWMGVTSDLTTGNFTSSTYANSIHCLLFGKKDGDTTWSTIRNNGGGTATQSDTKTEDESIHKTVITGNGTDMTLKHDTDTTSTYTTSIPSTTQPLAIIIWCNAESSTAKELRILDVNLNFTWKTGG